MKQNIKYANKKQNKTQNIKYANKQTKKRRIQKHPRTSSLAKQQ